MKDYIKFMNWAVVTMIGRRQLYNQKPGNKALCFKY